MPRTSKIDLSYLNIPAVTAPAASPDGEEAKVKAPRWCAVCINATANTVRSLETYDNISDAILGGLQVWRECGAAVDVAAASPTAEAVKLLTATDKGYQSFSVAIPTGLFRVMSYAEYQALARKLAITRETQAAKMLTKEDTSALATFCREHGMTVEEAMASLSAMAASRKEDKPTA